MHSLLRSRFGPLLDRTVKNCYMPCRFSSSSGSANDLPVKPKKPMSGLERYKLDVETELRRENPDLSPQDMQEVVRDLWRELDQKAKLPYKLAAKKDATEYMEACKLYECSLTDDQSAKILMKTVRNFRRKHYRKFDDMILKTGKPTRPKPIFTRFMSYLKTECIPMPNRRTHCRETAIEMWQNLESEVKEKIRGEYQRDLETYLEQKAKWEEKIMTGFKKWEDICNIAKNEKTMTDFKRPVKPPTSFLLYVEEIKKYNGKVPIDQVNRKWINMPQEQKDLYLTEAQKLHDNYTKELDEWNKKMEEYLGIWAKKIPSK